MYVDPKEGVKPGYPPPREVFGTSAFVIGDEMRETYHEGVQRHISSRKEWNQADEQSGKITFGTMDEPRRHVAKGASQQKRELEADRKQAAEKALAAYKANPKEVSARIAKAAEKQQKLAEKSGLSTLIDKAIK